MEKTFLENKFQTDCSSIIGIWEIINEIKNDSHLWGLFSLAISPVIESVDEEELKQLFCTDYLITAVYKAVKSKEAEDSFFGEFRQILKNTKELTETEIEWILQFNREYIFFADTDSMKVLTHGISLQEMMDQSKTKWKKEKPRESFFSWLQAQYEKPEEI